MKEKIGIRREDKSRWERRVPLTPMDLIALSEDPELEFVVQPSPIRVFTDDDYRQAGIAVNEDLSGAGVILAVKEIPRDLLSAKKTYVFFSHVIKGQQHNMPMLARLMELGCSLVDYERIVDDAGRRLIFFGVHAGYAGAIETLWCLGQRLRAAGRLGPFSALGEIRHAYEYESLDAAKNRLAALGERIRERGLGPSERPLILGIAGYGNVARGCQEVLGSLGVAEIAVADLPAVAAGKVAPPAPLLRVVFKEQDMVELLHAATGEPPHGPANEHPEFDLQDYYDRPERYRGCFDKHLPHLDVLINAAYWDERYPRLVTREWARRNYTKGQSARLEVIGDISCDLEGGIELTRRTTEPDAPCFTYDPQRDGVRLGCEGPGPTIMAVDNLPCELPRESSEEFSRALSGLLPELAGADWGADFDDLNLTPTLERAVIVHKGALAPDYRYLEEHLKKLSDPENTMKKVLVLGAGLVTRPLVGYLLDRGYAVTCASRTVAKAEKLIGSHPNGTACELDLNDAGRLTGFIQDCDLAVSLVPFAFHPTVARLCIDHGKPMVTTSYVSEEMETLGPAAKDAGVTILNEVGVDPGIDHMSAMRIIDDVKTRGGKIVAFKSYCGGLPAPECNDNPFGYKFSWAPRGVLLASRNGALYLQDGRQIEVRPERLFRDMHVLQVEDFGDFEAYPNRDSIAYIDIYGLEGIKTLFRGTLRNMGWCDTLYNFRRVGLLDLEEVEVAGKTYAEFTRALLDADPEADLRIAAAHKMGVPPDALPAWNLQWLGMFSDRELGVDSISPLDALGNLMFERLSFKPNERDMLVLYHDFRAEYPDGSSERITSRMIDFGIPGGDSSMSRTVSLPAAIGVDRILRGRIATPGVLRPVTPEIYEPVLDALSELGIECHESTENLEPESAQT